MLPTPACTPSLQGAKSGNVRFDTPAQAQAALGRAEDGKLMVAGYSAALRILEGEEEVAFLKVRGPDPALRAAAAQQRPAGHFRTLDRQPVLLLR